MGKSFSRARFFVAVGLLALFCAGSWYLGDYLWFGVESRAVAGMVYLGWLAVLLAFAWVVAGIVVALRYPETDSREDEDKPAARIFRRSELYRSALVVGLCVLEMLAAQKLSGGALFEYKAVQLEAMSRSRDPEELLALFSGIENMQKPEEVTRFVQKLPMFFEHRDERVRAASFHTMAVMAHRMNLSVYVLVKEGRLFEDRWEPEVVEWMCSDVAGKLAELYERGVTPAPAIIKALAWIIEPEALSWLMALVENPRTPDAVLVEAATGIGNIGKIEGVAPLVKAIPGHKGETLIRLLRALQRLGQSLEVEGEDETRDAQLLSTLEHVLELVQGFDDAGLCAAVTAVGGFQHAGLTGKLTALFDSDRAAVSCPRLEVKEPAGPPVVFVKEQKLRWLLLNLLADIGAGNRELMSWAARALEKPIADKEIHTGLMQLYGALTRQMDDD